MQRLRPEAVAGVGRQRLQLEPEDLLERGRGDGSHLVDRHRPPKLAGDRRELRVLEPAGSDPLRERRRVEVVHVQVLDESAPGAAEVLEVTQTTEEFYLAILELFHERWARAVAAVGDAPAGGVVVHCQGGKDRTGIMAALLLRLVGVPIADVAADYGETTRNLAEMNTAWIEAAEDEEERERRILFSRSEPETMEAVVGELERRHGSVRAYLLAGGATEEELERVHARLLD